jgi:hypothetical protein
MVPEEPNVSTTDHLRPGDLRSRGDARRSRGVASELRILQHAPAAQRSLVTNLGADEMLLQSMLQPTLEGLPSRVNLECMMDPAATCAGEDEAPPACSVTCDVDDHDSGVALPGGVELPGTPGRFHSSNVVFYEGV